MNGVGDLWMPIVTLVQTPDRLRFCDLHHLQGIFHKASYGGAAGWPYTSLAMIKMAAVSTMMDIPITVTGFRPAPFHSPAMAPQNVPLMIAIAEYAGHPVTSL